MSRAAVRRHWYILAVGAPLLFGACRAHVFAAAPVTPDATPAPSAAAVPAGPGTPAAPLWRVRENDVRCVQAPCPTLDVQPLDPPGELQRVTGLDLSALGLSARQYEAVMSEVRGTGLGVRGVVEERPDARGRMHKVLRAQSLASQ